MTETIRYGWGHSSLGDFAAAASDRGVVMVEFGERGGALVGALCERFPHADIVEDQAAMTEYLLRLAELIEHPEAKIELAVEMRGSDFERRVWSALRAIPAGTTVSYGDVAARIGSPGDAREVAEACAANTLAVLVPCHRVVKKDGAIAGYRWGFKRKRALIEREREAVRSPDARQLV
jgi:AraC family transcriptional regulator of adaptative response/methylated-DNA-[protein]-cysteine methyltransferase